MRNQSVYIGIYLTVEDYKTENKTLVDTGYEWEKMAAALISTWSHYQIPW